MNHPNIAAIYGLEEHEGTRFLVLELVEGSTLESNPIPGTDEVPRTPFFSRDGQWIGFYSGDDGQLKKIAVGGGAPVSLTDALPSFVAPSWGADDSIVFAQPDGIMRVSANGGAPEMLVAETNLGDPQSPPSGAGLNSFGCETAPWSADSVSRRRSLLPVAASNLSRRIWERPVGSTPRIPIRLGVPRVPSSDADSLIPDVHRQAEIG